MAVVLLDKIAAFPVKCPRCYRVVHMSARLESVPLPMCAAKHPPTMLLPNNWDAYQQQMARFASGAERRILIEPRNMHNFAVEVPGEKRADTADGIANRDGLV